MGWDVLAGARWRLRGESGEGAERVAQEGSWLAVERNGRIGMWRTRINR